MNLLCVDATPRPRAILQGFHSIGLVQGNVYTETRRWRCPCLSTTTYVWLAEATFPGRPGRCTCIGCGQDVSFIWGSYALFRFREIPPPNQLGITEQEVRELFTPSKQPEEAL